MSEELTPGEKIGESLAEAAEKAGPMGPPGPPGGYAPGGIVAGGGMVGSTGLHISASPPSVSTGVLRLPGDPPPLRKPLEHVQLPTRLPRRVLVAFLDDEGNPEPFWAAYLAPVDIEVSMCPTEPEDAHMDLRLSLVKRFEQ